MEEKEPIVIPYKVEMDLETIIRFQVIFVSFINGISLTTSDINTLVLLGLKGQQNLLSYCHELAVRKIYASPGSARNTIGKLTDSGLIIKSGRSKKKVKLADAVFTILEQPTFLNIQCYYDPNKV